MSILELLEGEKGMVESCGHKRLSEHGFVKDTLIYIYKKIPGITAIYLRGGIIACRDYELKNVRLKEKK